MSDQLFPGPLRHLRGWAAALLLAGLGAVGPARGQAPLPAAPALPGAVADAPPRRWKIISSPGVPEGFRPTREKNAAKP